MTMIYIIVWGNSQLFIANNTTNSNREKSGQCPATTALVGRRWLIDEENKQDLWFEGGTTLKLYRRDMFYLLTWLIKLKLNQHLIPKEQVLHFQMKILYWRLKMYLKKPDAMFPVIRETIAYTFRDFKVNCLLDRET